MLRLLSKGPGWALGGRREMVMRKREMRGRLVLVERLTRGQRQELADKLKAQASAAASVEVLESAGRPVACPHCKGERLVCNGAADGLQVSTVSGPR
jgi:hypothetical protein